MLIRVIAVGTRMPGWVEEAVADYTQRLPPEMRPEWREVRAEQRTRSADATRWMTREAERIRAALPDGAHIVVLDETGKDLDTMRLARTVERWREQARPVAILIGGPDGIDPALKGMASETIRLSSLTLAHAMVRVLLAEQLFRAWSILTGHPYHRA